MTMEGLGNLEAYIDADEGVAFEMDNELIWDSLGRSHEWGIRGVSVKKESSKFKVTIVPSGKVMLTDWNGACLTVMFSDEEPNIYPVRPIICPIGNATILFDVFYRANKVAFRAYNGLFLARVYRCYHTIEAAKTVADDKCFFRPMVGDICIPLFNIIKVTVYNSFESHLICVKTKRFVNRSYFPQTCAFSLTWDTTVTDRVTWKHLWGLGVANSRQIRIHGMRALLKYTEDNDEIVPVTRHILENHRNEVVVPPRSICTVRLLTKICDNAVLQFKAVIRKIKSNGGVAILHQRGVWAGLVYHDIHLRVLIEHYPDRSIIM